MLLCTVPGTAQKDLIDDDVDYDMPSPLPTTLETADTLLELGWPSLGSPLKVAAASELAGHGHQWVTGRPGGVSGYPRAWYRSVS